MANAIIRDWWSALALGVVETEGQVVHGPMNSAWVAGTSGSGVGVIFAALEGVSSGAISIWMFILDPVGAGTIAAQMTMHAVNTTTWETHNAATVVATSSSVTITTPGWYEFPFTGINMTQGIPYIFWLYNNSASPTHSTNHV